MRKSYFVGGVVAVALIIIALLFWGSRRAAPSPAASTGSPVGEAQSKTRESVPGGVAVPSVGSAASSNTAKPQEIAPAAQGSSITLFTFGDMKVENNKFTPGEIVVYAGDAVRINLFAIDKDYDFTQPDNGLLLPLPKGQKRTLEFQTGATGKFTFYCTRCGGPERGPVGYLIVVPKK